MGMRMSDQEAPSEDPHAPARRDEDLAVRLQCDRGWACHRNCAHSVSAQVLIQFPNVASKLPLVFIRAIPPVPKPESGVPLA
jgi:hypothetical protein